MPRPPHSSPQDAPLRCGFLFAHESDVVSLWKILFCPLVEPFLWGVHSFRFERIAHSCFTCSELSSAHCSLFDVHSFWWVVSGLRFVFSSLVTLSLSLKRVLRDLQGSSLCSMMPPPSGLPYVVTLWYFCLLTAFGSPLRSLCQIWSALHALFVRCIDILPREGSLGLYMQKKQSWTITCGRWWTSKHWLPKPWRRRACLREFEYVSFTLSPCYIKCTVLLAFGCLIIVVLIDTKRCSFGIW